MARPAPGVERTIALVTFLSERPGRSFGLSELARHLDLNKATAHSLLHALTEAAWLLRDPMEKTYRLGPALVAVGHAAGATPQVLEATRPHMRRLRDELGVTVVASAAMGDEIVVLAAEGDTREGAMRPGDRVPLTPPLGTVFMAWSDPDVVDRWLHRTTDGPGDDRLREYRQVIAAVRDRGYAVALGDDRPDLQHALTALATDSTNPDVRDAVEQVMRAMAERGDYLLLDVGASVEPYALGSIAAPVFDHSGHVVLALTLAGFPARAAGIDVARYGRRLVDATTAVTEAIGGRRPAEAIMGGDAGPASSTRGGSHD